MQSPAQLVPLVEVKVWEKWASAHHAMRVDTVLKKDCINQMDFATPGITAFKVLLHPHPLME